MFISALDYYDSYSVYEEFERNGLDVNSFVTSIFEDNKSGVIFGSCGFGKTTLLTSLIKESSDFGIVKNVYFSTFCEMPNSCSDLNFVFQEKNFSSSDEVATLLSFFNVERLFLDEANSSLDVDLILNALFLDIPVIFCSHSNSLSNFKKRLIALSSEEKANIIMEKLSFAIQPTKISLGDSKKHLFFHNI